MEENRNGEEYITQVLIRFVRKNSRRGFLARIWKLPLRVLGISLLPLLPVDRLTRKVEANVDCSDWRLQGLDGVSCANCCGGITACPSGCAYTITSAWIFCCCNPNPLGDNRYFKYIDCCGPLSSCSSCANAAYCANNPGQSVWYPGAPNNYYKCTKILDIGSCSV